MPNIAVPMTSPATFAPETVRSRKIPNRISGSAVRSSQPTNAASRATEPAKRPIVASDPQP